jgi:hypothetical protein
MSVSQVWNHTFFWESMKPNGGGEPTGKLADAIKASFGSLDEFKTQFKAAGGGLGFSAMDRCIHTQHEALRGVAAPSAAGCGSSHTSGGGAGSGLVW